MKNLIFYFSAICALYCCKANVAENRQRLLDTGMQLLEIETVDAEEPTCESVPAPAGCNGVGTINATKVPGRLVIRDATGVLYDSGAYKEKKSGLTIKIRGNTSATLPKKSFKLKLQKKADLFLRDDDDLKVKEWVLLPRGEWLNTAIGFELNRLMNLQWTPNYRYVNLMVNGDVRGIYILVDAVERNPPGRLDVDEASGYILEYDAYWWNEDVYFKTPHCPTGAGYTFRYPDAEDVASDQIAAISNAVDRAERSIGTGNYAECLDVDSFASWLVGQDVLGNIDGAGSNIYLTKYDLLETSLFQMGNMWDFDGIMQVSTWSTIHQADYFLFYPLLSSANPLYRTAYRAKWEQCRERLKTGLDEFFASLLDPAFCASYDAARAIDAERWGGTYASTSNEVASIAAWFDNRIAWIDEHIGEVYVGTPNVAMWDLSDTTQVVFTVTNAVPVAWTEQTNYLVTVVGASADGTGLGATVTQTVWVAAGSSVDGIKDVPECAGRSFIGWESALSVVDGPRTVFALYTNNVYSIVFVGALSDTSALPQTFTVDDEINLPALPAVRGNAFLRWSLPQIARGTVGDVTVQAVYATSSWAGYVSGDAFVGDKISNYIGYLTDAAGAIVGTIQLKTAKVRAVKGVRQSKVTGTLFLVGQKKETLSGVVDVDTGMATVTGKRGTLLSLSFGAGTVSGTCGDEIVLAVRNLTDTAEPSRKEVRAIAANLVGTYVAACPILSDVGATNGWQCLSTAVQSIRKASSKFYTAEGKLFSSSGLLLVGENESRVVVAVTSGGVLLQAYLLRLSNDGAVVAIDGDENWRAERFQPAKLSGTVELPNGKVVENARLSVNKVTGIVSGSVNVPASYVNTKRPVRFNVKGVVMDGIGMGMATRACYSAMPIQVR